MEQKTNLPDNSKLRLLTLYTEITPETVNDICYIINSYNIYDKGQLNKLRNYTPIPIHLYINSPGGEVSAAFELIGAITNSVAPVYTYVNGSAASAAFLVFLAGEHRFIGKYGVLMYHQISYGKHDTYKDQEEYLEHAGNIQETLETYILSRTKLTKKFLSDVRTKKKDAYFTAEEAIKKGLADEILEDLTGKRVYT